jgi:hypothetical protein
MRRHSIPAGISGGVQLNGRQQFQLAMAAAAAGLMWGYLRHRGDSRAAWFAIIQAAEWFVINGGATIALRAMRDGLERVGRPEDLDDFMVERITRTRQVVSERTGTDG